MKFSSKQRKDVLNGVNKQELDVIVIGGGITGSGIALDGATRGLSTIVFEMQDFAAGTSSRSTKLVHGGLRYLKQLEVKMVAEVGKERAIVYENGPHVTTPEWMLLPFHTGGTFGAFSTSIGLRVYDFLAGVKRSERRKMFNREETLNKEPLVKKEGLKGGGYYVEYRTDDARLTIEVMKEAIEHGAKAVNYAKVDGFLYKDGKVCGVRVIDLLDGEVYEVYGKKIVNAAGPWVDTLREKDNSKKGKVLQLSKGVHLVIDQKRFPLGQAIYFDTPDKRMVFAIPRGGKTYVGTTDTFYDKDAAVPHMTTEDRTYIINAINYMFPSVKITEKDVESSWAGVRPLIYEEGKNASEISRKDEIWTSESGLITIAGGKLTGYRKMAEMVVDYVTNLLQKEGHSAYPKSDTKHMPISGGHVSGSHGFPAFVAKKTDEGTKSGLTKAQAEEFAKFYGSNVDVLFDLAKKHKDEAKEYNMPLDVLIPLVYAMDYEMTAKPVDFFVRRRGAVFFNIHWVYEWKEAVINYMAAKLGWSKEEQMKYTAELEKALTDAVIPVDQQEQAAALA
ncbi:MULTISPECIES: aerobic glycerol-3-phosphate dehydrogenase [Bacillus cereus group]|uniref:Glycerol-3-phosphate dehydrogenase n=1 Tax=Bacillus thuringiensis TaxID=1428 RepID=A0A1C4AZJ6_BACTU|nr:MULTISPECIES: aerobic glycerol-3-phosphate dehydrogenase [Bacillus cereus group]MCC2325961.1 aerobic glycerol-3-phosphate dehydrogenase [Bacillus wiedmannii]MDP1457699.1 aerobic glycerol-3-phosphate dehydrogenase [Bacillus wiedmannii]MED3026230.1 aerobic glycerol-3-phosphate dehydrogenase [Bacillus wiedmannii]OTX96557.1 glycerol-3-phosphate dehydrogenase [Bacillus thuringiensis serovar wratislaviensis]OUB54883.1 glycerol-3-phosphate dehydrogenase [Bacillus thuringiensis serovar sylvestriens